MPLYEYKCAACGETTEAIRPVGDHLEHCDCGGDLRRVWSGPPIVYFRKRGWKPYSPETSARAELVKEEIAIG